MNWLPPKREDQIHNLGMCPDRGSNPQHFSAQNEDIPTTEPPGQGKPSFFERSNFTGHLASHMKYVV